MKEAGIETFCPANKKEWRSWLQEHHAKKQSVWLIYYKKSSKLPSLSWSEAVEEALCFGWVDSKKKTIDADKFMQLFSKRKKISTWSKINKEKIIQLINEGSITKAGLESIEIAKQNGSWKILDDVEKLEIPKDLEKEFKAFPGSKVFFLSLSRSVRKSMLQWIVLARRAETRQARIRQIAELAAQKQKPSAF